MLTNVIKWVETIGASEFHLIFPNGSPYADLKAFATKILVDVANAEAQEAANAAAKEELMKHVTVTEGDVAPQEPPTEPVAPQE